MKQIKDYPNYFITEFGDVYSSKHIHLKIMKQDKSNVGYFRISLSREAKNKKFLVHRLVALTFIPNPNNLPDVNHIDGNKLNNHISNLEWVTKQQNNVHALINGLRILPKGSSHYKSVLTNEQAEWIRKNYIPRHKEFSTIALSKKFNVNQSLISNIINQKRYAQK